MLLERVIQNQKLPDSQKLARKFLTFGTHWTSPSFIASQKKLSVVKVLANCPDQFEEREHTTHVLATAMHVLLDPRPQTEVLTVSITFLNY